MPKTDPEQGQIGLLKESLGQSDAMAHCRGIPRAVGEENPVRTMGSHRGEIRVSRKNGDIAAMGNQAVEDGPFDPEINGDNTERLIAALLQALVEANAAGLIPLIGITGADAIGQVQPRHGGGLFQGLKQLHRRLAITADHTIHGTDLTQMTHQCTGV